MIEVDDPIMTADGISYTVAELPSQTNEEGIPVVTRSKKLCGKYFFTVQFGEETHIGFQLLLPDKSGTPTLPYIMISSEKNYRPVSPSFFGQISPSVEFNNGNIIVHINPVDLAKAQCLNRRMFI